VHGAALRTALPNPAPTQRAARAARADAAGVSPPPAGAAGPRPCRCAPRRRRPRCPRAAAGAAHPRPAPCRSPPSRPGRARRPRVRPPRRCVRFEESSVVSHFATQQQIDRLPQSPRQPQALRAIGAASQRDCAGPVVLMLGRRQGPQRTASASSPLSPTRSERTAAARAVAGRLPAEAARARPPEPALAARPRGARALARRAPGAGSACPRSDCQTHAVGPWGCQAVA
jgi:hypothetical protein